MGSALTSWCTQHGGRGVGGGYNIFENVASKHTWIARVLILLHNVAHSLKGRTAESQQPAVTRQRPVDSNRGMVFSEQSVPMAEHTTLKYVMPSLSKQLHCKRGTVFSVRSVPRQCPKCQKFGHVWANCKQLHCCMWCGGDHLQKECPEKGNTSSTPTCCNCRLAEGEKPHPANYRGCR
jgi:hypothetical protein